MIRKGQLWSPKSGDADPQPIISVTETHIWIRGYPIPIERNKFLASHDLIRD